jgi:hypothetical protein
MLVNLILGSVTLMGGAFAGGLFLVILGIRRGDHGKRLIGRPGSKSEAFARRVLTGSRGYDSTSDAGEDR